MLCEDPHIVHDMLVRCQQCETCRASRVSIWANRILLEAELYAENNFITLTYSDEYLPAFGSLVPRDFQLFLKRLRKSDPYRRIRFYGCGEYGSNFGRPHYHAILFNFPHCQNGITSYRTKFKNGGLCCPACDQVQSAWSISGSPIGGVRCGTVEEASARYVAGYLFKGATRTDDPRLTGRWPEFSRMSNRPGIGFGSMRAVAETFKQYGYDNDGVVLDDVPAVLRRGKKFFSYGRYLRGVVRAEAGVSKEMATALAVEREREKVRILREAASASSQSIKEVYRGIVAQPVANWKSRQKLKNRKRL